MTRCKFVMHVESYSARDGVIVLCASSTRARYAIKDIADLCAVRHGGYMTCEMAPPYKHRSLSQNDKYWALCTEFGNYCGMTKDDVSMGVKYRAMEEGLWRGEDMPFSASGMKRPVSTATASTAEMSVLIDVLYRIAAEDGYVFSE